MHMNREEIALQWIISINLSIHVPLLVLVGWRSLSTAMQQADSESCSTCAVCCDLLHMLLLCQALSVLMLCWVARRKLIVALSIETAKGMS